MKTILALAVMAAFVIFIGGLIIFNASDPGPGPCKDAQGVGYCP